MSATAHVRMRLKMRGLNSKCLKLCFRQLELTRFTKNGCGIKNDTKPEHIAIILDGNRRWASERTLNPWLGHEKGAEKVDSCLIGV